MRSVDKATRYGVVSRSLHWAVAGAIALQFLLSQLAERAGHDGERLRQLALLANHKSVGITILALAVLRLVWRVAAPPPALPTAMPPWQHRAAKVTHWALYGALFAMPVTGWLMSSASAYSVSWFGLFTLPDLIGPDADMKAIFEELHESLAKVLIAVVAIHFLAALKHHFIDRDDVLRRMSSIPTVALLFVVFAAGALLLTPERSDAPSGRKAQSAVPRPAPDARHEVGPASGPEARRVTDAMADRDPDPGSEPRAETAPRADTGPDQVPDAGAGPTAEPPAEQATEAKPGARGQPEPEPVAERVPTSESGETSVADVPPLAASGAEADAGGRPASGPDPERPAEVQSEPRADPAAARPAADPKAATWSIDYADSHIRFTAEQAGADFTGEWTDWSADMRFSEAALADSRFVVEIRVAGVDTRERDARGEGQDPPRRA